MANVALVSIEPASAAVSGTRLMARALDALADANAEVLALKQFQLSPELLLFGAQRRAGRSDEVARSRSCHGAHAWVFETHRSGR
jgi:hypothetical protein